MKVIYKAGIRNGYVKIENGEILVLIPLAAQGNKHFLEKMQALAEQEQNGLKKKTKHQIFTSEGVLLFGERVPKTQRGKAQTEKAWNKLFQEELMNYANPILNTLAQRIGIAMKSLTVRKVKTKRGSCTYDNRIMLNQNLVHLPTKLTQYVIIHEACHLKEKNHSKNFWSLVEQYCPNYKALRKELKNQIFVE